MKVANVLTVGLSASKPSAIDFASNCRRYFAAFIGALHRSRRIEANRIIYRSRHLIQQSTDHLSQKAPAMLVTLGAGPHADES